MFCDRYLHAETIFRNDKRIISTTQALSMSLRQCPVNLEANDIALVLVLIVILPLTSFFLISDSTPTLDDAMPHFYLLLART